MHATTRGMLVGLLVWLLPAVLHAQTCTHWISQGGNTGNSCPVGTPCTVQRFLAIATAGNVGCMNDGTYTGDASMPQFPSGLSGTSGNPITLRALNDGAVLIDGQQARGVGNMNTNNTWITMQGFNMANSDGSIINYRGANNIMRRMVLWDLSGDTGNHSQLNIDVCNGCLLEDVAVFGAGRYNVVYQTGTSVTLRRVFAKFLGSNTPISAGPTCGINMGYNGTGGLGENLLATWDSTGNTPNQPVGPLCLQGNEGVTTEMNNLRILGSFAFVQNGASFPGPDIVQLPTKDDVHLVDVYAFAGTNFSSKSTFDLSGFGGTQNTADHITSVGGTDITSTGDWTLTNTESGAAVANVSSAFTGATGATLCFQYVNGSLTATPLWPWPMNQRIIDAMTTAGVTAVDVTATVESILGTIPTACRSDVAGSGGTLVYWPLNESSGSTVADVSGNAHTGTITGSPTFVGGRKHRGLRFTAAGQQMAFSGVTVPASATIAFWIYPEATSNTGGRILSEGNPLGILFNGTTRKVNFYYSGTDHVNNTALPENAWTHIMITNTAGAVTFYRNSFPDGTATGAPGFAPTGMGDLFSGETFLGILDDVRIFDTALTTAQLRETYFADVRTHRRMVVR
jgi:Concanavalin A-like lectin/glucanases superfamily